MSAPRRSAHELIRRAVAMVDVDCKAGGDPDLCFFCQHDGRGWHTADCPWPEMVAESARAPVFQPGVAYMPVPRCDSCRWWKRATRGTREADQTPQTYGDCAMATDQSPGRPKHPESKARGWGDGPEVDRNGLSTAADFGCVQWEAKE